MNRIDNPRPPSYPHPQLTIPYYGTHLHLPHPTSLHRSPYIVPHILPLFPIPLGTYQAPNSDAKVEFEAASSRSVMLPPDMLVSALNEHVSREGKRVEGRKKGEREGRKGRFSYEHVCEPALWATGERGVTPC